MKRCTRCGILKPHAEFYRDKPGPKTAKNGLRPKCKECTKALAKQRYDKKGPRSPEKNREAQRRFHERHPGRDAEYGRRWREKNGERAKELARANLRKYRREKPERHVASQMRRRTQVGTISREDADYIAILRGDPCSYCGGPAKPIDHIEPLWHGGNGGWENLTASCQCCNSSKRVDTLLSFLLRTASRS